MQVAAAALRDLVGERGSASVAQGGFRGQATSDSGAVGVAMGATGATQPEVPPHEEPLTPSDGAPPEESSAGPSSGAKGGVEEELEAAVRAEVEELTKGLWSRRK